MDRGVAMHPALFAEEKLGQMSVLSKSGIPRDFLHFADINTFDTAYQKCLWKRQNMRDVPHKN